MGPPLPPLLLLKRPSCPLPWWVWPALTGSPWPALLIRESASLCVLWEVCQHLMPPNTTPLPCPHLQAELWGLVPTALGLLGSIAAFALVVGQALQPSLYAAVS